MKKSYLIKAISRISKLERRKKIIGLALFWLIVPGATAIIAAGVSAHKLSQASVNPGIS